MIASHQQRVVNEKTELDEKRASLLAFFASPTFTQLHDAERGRLQTQFAAMKTYSDILGERIGAF